MSASNGFVRWVSRGSKPDYMQYHRIVLHPFRKIRGLTRLRNVYSTCGFACANATRSVKYHGGLCSHRGLLWLLLNTPYRNCRWSLFASHRCHRLLSGTKTLPRAMCGFCSQFIAVTACCPRGRIVPRAMCGLCSQFIAVSACDCRVEP